VSERPQLQVPKDVNLHLSRETIATEIRA